MLKMEELLNQISVENTRDRTVQLIFSKIDLDYAYGEMKLSEETSRQCVFALIGARFSRNYRCEKGFTDSPLYRQYFKKNRLNIGKQYPAWLDDIIVVTRGSKQDYERKVFEVLAKLEKAGRRASNRRSDFF